jgi:hypothetical protein
MTKQITLLICTFFLLACSPGKTELKNIDDGKNPPKPPTNAPTEQDKLVAPDDIAAAFKKAWGDENFDGAQFNKDEKIWFSKTIQNGSGTPKEYELGYFQVLEIDISEDSNSGLKFRDIHMLVANQKIGFEDSQPPVEMAEYTYRFEAPGSTFKKLNNPPSLGVHKFALYSTACYPDAAINWNPSCYNFKVWDSLEPAPEFAAKQPGCRGLKDCKMRVTNISYDLFSEGKRSPIKIQISRDLPYLSRFVSDCYTGSGTYQNETFESTVCTKVSDFESASP